MESLLSVALSKSIGCTMNGNMLMSEVRIQYLNNIIKGSNNFDDILDTVKNNDENPEIERFSERFFQI